jgi:hypothetical protein
LLRGAVDSGAGRPSRAAVADDAEGRGRFTVEVFELVPMEMEKRRQ